MLYPSLINIYKEGISKQAVFGGRRHIKQFIYFVEIITPCKQSKEVKRYVFKFVGEYWTLDKQKYDLFGHREGSNY